MVPDGLDPGIDINDEPDDTADIAKGKALLEMVAPELIAVDDTAIGKRESLAAGSEAPVETGCCD